MAASGDASEPGDGANESGGGPSRPLRALRRLEDGVLALLLTSMILLASLQILLRNVFESGIGWADPLVRVLVLWVGLLGALAASRDDRHINVDVLARLLPERPRRVTSALTSFFTAAVAGVVAYQSLRFVISELEFGGVGPGGLPSWGLASIIPIAFGGTALRYLLLALDALRAARHARPEAPR